MQPVLGNRGPHSARWSTRIARRPRLALLVVGLTSLCISITASIVRWPVPSIHDEFSYLLMADTFAAGRLTNPTHPAWQSLESFHIIHQPTYASKYPPAQGFVLAIGQLFFGHPIVGVWLSTALACAAVCWMLRGWVSPRWALWGGLLFTLQGGIQFLWGQSYWGGCVALTGGALLFGAAPRLLERVSVRHSLCLAIGLILLANSRPFEGLLLSLPVAAWLLATWLKRRALWQGEVLVRFALPVCLCLSTAGAAMAYYNFRVTGNPLKMPYSVYQKEYSIASLFVWKEAGSEPDYRHDAMRDFSRDYGLKNRQERANLLDRIKSKEELVRFYASPAVLLPLLGLPWIIRRRDTWFVAAVVVLMGLSTLLVYAGHPHYFAPAAPLLILLSVKGLRCLVVLGRRRRAAFGWIVPAIVLLHFVRFANIAHEYVTRPAQWGVAKVETQKRLEQLDARHLVLVRYSDKHCGHEEWVYNRADIDAARIVWARDRGPACNAETISKFPGRRLWSLEADRLPRKLVAIGESR